MRGDKRKGMMGVRAWIMLVGLLVCGVALAGCGETEEAAPRAASAQEKAPLRVVCAGDSNTEGYGATSYTAFLAETLGPDYTVQNLGVSGTTAMASGSYPYTETAAYRESLAAEADIVVLMLGTNDTACWRGGEVFADEYEDLVASYLALDPKPRLILCTPPAPQDEDWPAGMVSFGVQPAAYAAVNEAVRASAARHDLAVVDVYGLTAGQSSWFLDDGIHLADAGAEAVAAEIAPVIRG